MVEDGTGVKAKIFAGQILTARVSFRGLKFYNGNPNIIKKKSYGSNHTKKRLIHSFLYLCFC
jgi:hypothetical protein